MSYKISFEIQRKHLKIRNWGNNKTVLSNRFFQWNKSVSHIGSSKMRLLNHGTIIRTMT